MMGKLWRVDETLEDSEGLRWIRVRLGAYNWSEVDCGSPSGADEVRGTRFGGCVSRLRRGAGTGSTAA